MSSLCEVIGAPFLSFSLQNRLFLPYFRHSLALRGHFTRELGKIHEKSTKNVNFSENQLSLTPQIRQLSGERFFRTNGAASPDSLEYFYSLATVNVFSEWCCQSRFVGIFYSLATVNLFFRYRMTASEWLLPVHNSLEHIRIILISA